MHHFPTPKIYGGKATIALCGTCHDLVSRRLLRDWPDSFWTESLSLLSQELIPTGARLLFLKVTEKFWT
jgi:hypothetical protein